MSKDNGGPAFASQEYLTSSTGESYFHKAYPGMTLRDYFAAKVMQGMWACADVRGNSEALARGAYEMADAMLKERDK